MEALFAGFILSIGGLIIYMTFGGLINLFIEKVEKKQESNFFNVISSETYYMPDKGNKWEKYRLLPYPYYYEKNNRFLIYRLKGNKIIVKNEDGKYKLLITYRNDISDSEIEIYCHRFTPFKKKLEYRIKIDRKSKTLTKYYKEAYSQGKNVYKYS